MSNLPHDSHPGGPVRTGAGNARTMTIIGFVCAGLALIFLPVVFGGAAIVLGIIAWRKGDPLGVWAAVAGAVAIVLAIVIVASILNNRNT